MDSLTTPALACLAAYAVGFFHGTDRSQPPARRLVATAKPVLIVTLGWLLGALLWPAGCAASSPRPTATVTTSQGDTLSALARVYAPGSDWRPWAFEVRRLNGRRASPWVQVGTELTVPDWRQKEGR